MKPRITQKDVAREAGVSHMTVSLALRSHPSIPAATRERILEICQRLGYAPDPLLSSLSAYRTSKRPLAYQSNLAWINIWKDPEEIHYLNSDFSDYYTAAFARARELGYNLEEIRMADIGFNARRLEKILKTKGITGLALPPAPYAGAELDIDFSRLAAVRFGYSYRTPQLHTVVNAQFRTAIFAMQNIIRLGYRRIGIILSHDLDERTSWNFLGGYLAAQQLLPAKERIEPFYPKAADTKELQKWIKRSRLDCVVGLGYSQAALACEGVGYADLAVSREEKFLSGTHQNALLIGSTAIDVLTAAIHRGETGIPESPIVYAVESRWVQNQSATEVLLRK